MRMLRRSTLVQVQRGEVICPLKSNPFPAVISVTNCKAMHDQRPEACARNRCDKYVQANAEVADLLTRAPDIGGILSGVPIPGEELEHDEDQPAGAP